ncbi:Reverse transcriptase (RNA-dependent DNA polymerase), putative [Trypanosoma equiperdum]|uniref:Reverse transcriptase (RNA-dependent DNA polymerase), putative n=1 Tax=Trypanosoma equiperdum TaxID=5694 RepID=A0A1G4IJL7_TRYEQ|nr:Reverse transcriptase (RNA-dependent DNA polymerase), putative [Trypanosoma equiperdum]
MLRPSGSVFGPLLFIVKVDSPSKRLNCIPGFQHGFFADDFTIVCASSDLNAIQLTVQRGLDCIKNLSAEKTECTLFGARDTNILNLRIGVTVKEVHTPKLLSLTIQLHNGLRKHARSVKAAADTRLMQLREVASSDWGPDRERL